MRRTRKAKILATLGPASSDAESITRLFMAGADVFRLNFSHGTHEEHAARYETIRALESQFGRSVGVLADLQGPKLRLGKFAGGRVTLEAGAPFRLDLSDEPGDVRRAPMPHPEIFAALVPGTDLLLDDGKVRLSVQDCGSDFAETRVVTPGPLSDRKGVNVPSVMLDLSPLTEKDRYDLAFALDLGVDWVALSFVQRPEDIAEALRLIGGRASLLAKLEKPTAVDHLFEIVDLADAVMVARGDLGVEVPPEDVPALQKRIIRACRYAGKPVVVATQMLDSMVAAPMPTRAEASDVATAVYDGADAVMLSAETASGDYPIESVAMMDRIIARVERDPPYRGIIDGTRAQPAPTASDAITAAARHVAQTISAAAIVTFSSSGSTTLRAARERPPVPILGLTSLESVARSLTLVWGVHSVLVESLDDFDTMVEVAVRIATETQFAGQGAPLVVTAGLPLGTRGSTNVLRIAWVE